jgi:hypothetical protein
LDKGLMMCLVMFLGESLGRCLDKGLDKGLMMCLVMFLGESLGRCLDKGLDKGSGEYSQEYLIILEKVLYTFSKRVLRYFSKSTGLPHFWKSVFGPTFWEKVGFGSKPLRKIVL